MPRDGNGTYIRTNGVFSGASTWTQQADSPDKVIDPGRHDTHDEDIAFAMTGSLARDGQGGMTGDLNMGNNLITNLKPAVADTNASTFLQATTATATGGSVSVRHADRFGWELTVKDFGAVGDNVAFDDQAFTDAEAYRLANGYTYSYVPPGNYLLQNAPNWERIWGPGNISYNGKLFPAGDIYGSFTIDIPGNLPTLPNAFTYLGSRRIRNKNTIVTIQFADGTYDFANRFLGNHPDGSRINILGNVATPANCVMNFTHAGVQDGFVVDAGHTIGLLDGFTIQTPAKAAVPNIGIGLLADTNGTILCGTNMVVQNFYYSVAGRFNGHVTFNGGLSDTAGDAGISGVANGSVDASNATAQNAVDVANNRGIGIRAEGSGVVYCPNALAQGNHILQIVKNNDGVIWSSGGTATGEDPRVMLQNNRVQGRGNAADVNVILQPKGNGLVELTTPAVRTLVGHTAYIPVTIDGAAYRIMLADG